MLIFMVTPFETLIFMEDNTGRINWIELRRNKIQRWTILIMEMNLQVP
jgi:hypothetical protein